MEDKEKSKLQKKQIAKDKRRLTELDKIFMQMMTDATGCVFVDVTPKA